MHKNLLLSFLISITLASCSKENYLPSGQDDQRPSAINTSAALPSSFTQKVLLEMYSSAICATCPDAMYKYEQYALQHPDRVYGADVHDNDPMEISLWNTLDSTLNITQYSSGSFNRKPFNGTAVIPKTMWQSGAMLTTALAQTATCGLKINSSVVSGQAEIKVDAGFNAALSGDYRLTVYLVEDSVTGSASGYNQANYYNTTPSSPFYQLGNPMIGYRHNCVVRIVLTANKGMILSTNGNIVPKTYISKSFTAQVSGYNTSRLYVIAFINHNGASVTSQEILNVQRIKLGSNCNWN